MDDGSSSLVSRWGSLPDILHHGPFERCLLLHFLPYPFFPFGVLRNAGTCGMVLWVRSMIMVHPFPLSTLVRLDDGQGLLARSLSSNIIKSFRSSNTCSSFNDFKVNSFAGLLRPTAT